MSAQDANGFFRRIEFAPYASSDVAVLGRIASHSVEIAQQHPKAFQLREKLRLLIVVSRHALKPSDSFESVEGNQSSCAICARTGRTGMTPFVRPVPTRPNSTAQSSHCTLGKAI